MNWKQRLVLNSLIHSIVLGFWVDPAWHLLTSHTVSDSLESYAHCVQRALHTVKKQKHGQMFVICLLLYAYEVDIYQKRFDEVGVAKDYSIRVPCITVNNMEVNENFL